MKMYGNKMILAALAVVTLLLVTVMCAGLAEAASTNTPAPTQVIPPAQVSLPPVPAEALRMSEAGVSDDSITSYIQKSSNPYTLDANQIIYLHDLGVSSTVLNALVTDEQSGTGDEVAQVSSVTATTGTQGTSSTGTPPVSGSATDFYYSLAPYGTWLDVPTYGWCWQPTVAAVDSGWQPYCNNGYWLWTDQGWYWNSYYTWGWAPFHYGRWCQYPGYGWIWCPDNTWGPAWVCWRDYPGYCGWAPLPPGASFTTSLGWTYNGAAVGLEFGFGLGPGCFTFCNYDNFCQRHPYHYFRHGHDADRFFHRSTVDNRFGLDAHHHFVNRGIAPSRIEAITHRRIQQVTVHEFHRGTGHSGNFIQTEHWVRGGNVPAIYRHDQNSSLSHNPSLTSHGWQFSSRRENNFHPAHHIPNEHIIDRASRFQPTRPDEQRHITPGSALQRSDAEALSHHWDPARNFQPHPSMPEPIHHFNFSRAEHFAPMQHFAPSLPASHGFSQPHPAFHSPPSHGGGGGTHFGGGMGSGRDGHGFHR